MSEDIKNDGRNARRNRSRERILQAAFFLVERGNWRPSVKDIAARAGVSVRTVFDIFGTLDDVYEELILVHATSLRNIIYQAFPDTVFGLAVARLALLGRLPVVDPQQESV